MQSQPSPVCPSCGSEAPAETALCPRCGTAIRDPLIGAVLGDRYLIVSQIGVGGMGAVYRAEHTTLKRELAIKVLLPEFGGKDEFVRRFEREAESASRLSHPHIIAVTDFGRTPEGLLFLAMEYLDGRSLTSLIREGPLGVARALGIARQILAGLNRAHGAGVVHRDLKPDNIMLIDREGNRDFVKILDFGIAKVTDPAPGREALTQAGMVFGTPEYLSPEQALGDTIDARADLYALGVIMFEMLAGQRPFESEDKVRIISMHLSHVVPRLAAVNPAVEVPPAIEEVVAQALEKPRENRFASAAAMLVALDEAERLGGGGSVHAPRGRPAGATPADARGTSATAALTAPSVATGGLDDTVAAAARSTPPLDSPATRSSSPSRSDAARPRRIRRLAIAGAALAALGTTGGVLLWRRPSSPGTVATGRVRPPQAPSAEVAARLRVIEGLLATGELVKARVALEQLLTEDPRIARVHYLLGRLAFADDRRAEGLARYREALTLDPGFRGDPVLLEHVAAALGDAKVADPALDLAIEKIGQPAADQLVKIANGPGELHRRQRAARALEELGQGRRVDVVMLRVTELKKAQTCEERKPLVVALGQSEDVRALPMLRAQRPRGLDALLGNDSNSACMKTELADAIENLEGKLPADKRPAAKQAPPAQPTAPQPGRRASARGSLFRGR